MRIRGAKAVLLIGGLLTIILPAPKPAVAGACMEKTPARLFMTLEEALSDAGRPALLVFFSTTCRVCWDDLFEAKAMIEAIDSPVELVGISLEKPEELEAFLRKYSFPYPVVSDRKRLAHRRFRVRAAPFKLLLLDGAVCYRDDLRQDLKTQRERLRQCLIGLTSKSRLF